MPAMRSRRAVLACVFLAAAASAGLWLVQTRQGRLSRGQPERGVLQPGSPRSWWVALERDEHAEVAVRSEEPALSARLLDPSGAVRRTLAAEDSGLLLRWIADREGRWRIEVGTSPDPGAGDGPVPYSIELTAVRAPTAQDRLAWEAEEADEQVRQALAGKSADGDRALDLLPRAVAAREKLLRDDPRGLARYLNDLASELAGGCDATPERWRSADSLLVRASRLYEAGGSAPAMEVAETLSNLAVVASYQGRWDRAEWFQRRVLDLDRRHPPPDVELGYDLVGLASIRFEQGHYQEVESLLSRALEIFQGAEPRDGFLVADVFNRLGELHRALGSYGDAVESFKQAYDQAHGSLPEGDLFFADLDNNLAGIHRDLGEHHKAEPLLQQALKLCEESADCCPRRLATAQLNLAETFRTQGDFERAGPLYSSALTLAMSSMAEDDPELAWSLNQQGLFFAEQGDPEQAILFYEEARAVTERTFGREHPMVALSLQDLARLHGAAGRSTEAEALYLRALAIRQRRLGERHPETAETLTRLGELYAGTGRVREAEAHLARAIEIFVATEAFPEAEADAWAARAKLAKSRGNLAAALSELERSIEVVERLRPLIGGGEQTRARFLSRHQDLYERMIEWQIEAGDLDRAFEYAERVRARVLMDQLFANQVDLRAGMPPEVRRPLETKRGDALARHAELEKRIAHLERGRESAGEAAPDLLAGLLRERDAARVRLEEVEEEIRNASPLWKAAAGGEPVRLSEAQAGLIPPGGLILLYQIGPESGHLFLLPPLPAAASALPLAVPPALAPALGVSPGPLNRERLLEILRGPTGAAGLLGKLGSRPARGAARGAELFPALHALRQVLLPGDTWARVRASSLAVVVPEGVLHGFPFEALAVTRGGQDGIRYWLDEGPVIRYAASATALRKLTDRSRLREPGPSRSPMLVSVAAPRFTAPRKGKRPEPQAPADLPPFRGSLSPLPGTLEEAERILSAFGSLGGALLLKDAEASEARVRAALKGARYLHFATHGIVDERRSGMFAGLALAPPEEVVDTGNDGFLQLFEIYGLDLSCELAVLSACQTRLGPEVEGEGVFALSRGFLVAGADRVVASLWRVDDQATAELIGDFFQQIVSAGRRGRSPAFAEALRQARRKIRSQARWSDPYYWAPFVLDGMG